MKKVKLILVTVLFTALVFNTSCKREGCTDADATNYDEKAKEDDGSCTYKAGLVIWWNQSFSEDWLDDGCNTVKVYFDGTLIDSKAISTYWPNMTSCSGGINKQFDLGKLKTKTVKVKLLFEGEDEDGEWTDEEEETLTLNAKDKCLIYQWEY